MRKQFLMRWVIRDFDLGIWLTSNKMIHKYNKEYREKDKPTDVLSFPYHTELKAGERIKVKTEEDKNLGDLIIAPEYVMNDLPKWETTFDKHMQRLIGSWDLPFAWL